MAGASYGLDAVFYRLSAFQEVWLSQTGKKWSFAVENDSAGLIHGSW